ncbi:MAG: hypothetical protein WCT42_01625 [Candidatus Paceibacterota bacterium]
MIESFKSPEGVTEQQVIDALNTKGIEDPETKALLLEYVDHCHDDADKEARDNPELSNRINLLTEIKIALLYSKTEKYKEYAIESLEDIYTAASQDDLTRDLAEQIGVLINKFNF